MNFTQIGLFFSNIALKHSLRETVEDYNYSQGPVLYDECYAKCAKLTFDFPHPHEFSESLVRYLGKIINQSNSNNLSNGHGHALGFPEILTLPTPLNYRFWS